MTVLFYLCTPHWVICSFSFSFFLGFSQLLFSQLIHSPGSQRRRDRAADPAHSFFYAKEKESETESGNGPSVGCKWITEVSQQVRPEKKNLSPVSRKWMFVRTHTVQMHHWHNLKLSCDHCFLYLAAVGWFCWSEFKVFSVWAPLKHTLVHTQRQYPGGNMRGLLVIHSGWGENGLALDCRWWAVVQLLTVTCKEVKVHGKWRHVSPSSTAYSCT